LSQQQHRPDRIDAQRFETAYRELQQVIERLEQGALPLEEALQLFERGSELVRECQAIVEAAQLRVTRLAGEVAAPVAEPAAK
jgi:exodeoxyribonuclease VII small subunit